MKVGDYVRTKDDIEQTIIITKIIETYKDCIVGENNCLCGYEDIIKSNPNIIDLIEVGDYVNGLKVDEIDEKGIYNYNSYDGWRVNIASCNEDIKSIVTKQQFEEMKYEIK